MVVVVVKVEEVMSRRGLCGVEGGGRRGVIAVEGRVSGVGV